jgi:ribosome maturation protein Sdo1
MSQTGKRRRISEIHRRNKRRGKRKEIIQAIKRGATDPVTDRKFTGLVMQDVSILRELRGPLVKK